MTDAQVAAFLDRYPSDKHAVLVEAIRAQEETESADWPEHWYRVAAALGRRPWAERNRPVVEVVAQLASCERDVRGGHPLLLGALSRRQQRAVQAYTASAEPMRFASLLSAEVPSLVIRPEDLARVRLTEDSLANFRARLTAALRALPIAVTGDVGWQDEAAALTADVLGPVVADLRRELRGSNALASFRSAGESVAFSVAGLALGTAVGGQMKGAVVVTAAGASAAKAVRDLAVGRRDRRQRRQVLTTLYGLAPRQGR